MFRKGQLQRAICLSSLTGRYGAIETGAVAYMATGAGTAHINTQPAVTYLKKVTFHEVESGEH